jgi:tetratricopeptide (TPR) repeat protein
LFILRLAYFSLLLALFSLCRHVRLQRILAPVSAGIALIVFLYGIIQKFFIFPQILDQVGPGVSLYEQSLRSRVASGRIFAIFPLPTLYAMVCGLLLIFIIHYLVQAHGKNRIVWSLLLLLGGCNLFLTQSFGGILFFTIGVLFYLFTAGIFKIKYLAPLLMVLALVFFLVTALRFSEARQLAPAKLRFVNWLQAGRVLATAPLLGVGLGNYETAVPTQVFPGEPASIYAHNFFLQLAAETGIPMFILLVVVSLPFIKKNLANLSRRENALFAAASIQILFFCFFDVGIYFFAAGISLAVVSSQIAAVDSPPRPRHFIAAVPLALLLLVSEAGASQQRSGDLWLGRRDQARAISHYRRALACSPWAYRAWLGLAHIAWEKKDLAAAERFSGKVMDIYPGQPYANYLLSRAAWSRGAYLTALFHSGRAASADKKNNEYQRWHEIVQSNFAKQPALSGN